MLFYNQLVKGNNCVKLPIIADTDIFWVKCFLLCGVCYKSIILVQYPGVDLGVPVPLGALRFEGSLSLHPCNPFRAHNGPGGD